MRRRGLPEVNRIKVTVTDRCQLLSRTGAINMTLPHCAGNLLIEIVGAFVGAAILPIVFRALTHRRVLHA